MGLLAKELFPARAMGIAPLREAGMRMEENCSQVFAARMDQLKALRQGRGL